MDYEKMTKAELRQALAETKAQAQKIQDAIDAKAKASESFRPGDKLEVSPNGDIRLVESSEEKRLREASVRAFMDLGLSRPAAEAAADRGTAA